MFDLSGADHDRLLECRPEHASAWLRLLIDAQLSGRHRNHPGTLESQAARLSNLLGEPAASRCLPPRGWLSAACETTTFWGQTHTLDIHDVLLASSVVAASKALRRRVHKIAFIIGAPQRSNITDAMIDSVDTIRQYPTFGAAADGQRRSSSTLT